MEKTRVSVTWTLDKRPLVVLLFGAQAGVKGHLVAMGSTQSHRSPRGALGAVPSPSITGIIAPATPRLLQALAAGSQPRAVLSCRTEALKTKRFCNQAELHASGKKNVVRRKTLECHLQLVEIICINTWQIGTICHTYIYARINMYTCTHNTGHEQREDELNWILKGKITKHGNHNTEKN